MLDPRNASNNPTGFWGMRINPWKTSKKSVETHTGFNTADVFQSFRVLAVVPALCKIIDEILVNAADNKVNDVLVRCMAAFNQIT